MEWWQNGGMWGRVHPGAWASRADAVRWERWVARRERAAEAAVVLRNEAHESKGLIGATG